MEGEGALPGGTQVRSSHLPTHSSAARVLQETHAYTRVHVHVGQLTP